MRWLVRKTKEGKTLEGDYPEMCNRKIDMKDLDKYL